MAKRASSSRGLKRSIKLERETFKNKMKIENGSVLDTFEKSNDSDFVGTMFNSLDQNDPLGNITVGNITSPPTCCCKELIAAQDTKLKALSDKMETMLRMMTVQTALINVLVSGEKSPTRLAKKFPLKTDADLLEVEQMIGIEKDFYVEAIKLKLDGNILKNMEELIHRDIVLMYNMDGTHGKKRFRDFVNLYDAIKASISNGDKDETIRKAFQVVKKRHYRFISDSRSKQHNT